MTAPAPSPASESPQGGPAVERSGPSKKTIIGWTLAMFAALGLAWFIGAVVVPVMKTRPAVERCTSYAVSNSPPWRKEIEYLGGPEQALHRLRLYVRFPKWVAPHRGCAASLLGYCGPKATPTLLRLLSDDAPEVRACAARELGGNKDSRAVEALIAALGDEVAIVRVTAAEALGASQDRRAIGPLVLLLRDDEQHVRLFAAKALETIGDLQGFENLWDIVREDNRGNRDKAIAALLAQRSKEEPGK
jgi:HEAT repeats